MEVFQTDGPPWEDEEGDVNKVKNKGEGLDQLIDDETSSSKEKPSPHDLNDK